MSLSGGALIPQGVANATEESIIAPLELLYEEPKVCLFRRWGETVAASAPTWHLGLRKVANRTYLGRPGLYGTMPHDTQSPEFTRSGTARYETVLVGRTVHDSTTRSTDNH
ncbi:hypothetical protein BHM03_00055389 [Ensete ventricosum]|nr:hypothetical protein BHM03_00055389 [Ensete ventricosum]